MRLRRKTMNSQQVSTKNVQRVFFRTQVVLIISLALILGIAGTLINIHFETEKRDQNLQNVAETIACSPLLMENGFIPVSLGNNVLRAETAPIVCASMINYEFMR